MVLVTGASKASDGPSRSEVRTEIDGRTLSGGLILFGGAYGIALAIPVSEGFDDARGFLAVPGAGPWIALEAGADVDGWAIAADGVLQLSGAFLIGLALTHPRRTLGPAKSCLPSVQVGLSLRSRELRVGTEF